MRIVSRSLVYDASRQPPARRVACFTSLCPLASGAVLCGFQAGPSKHAPTTTIRLCRSDDGGASWCELPAEFATVVDGVPGSLAAGELVEAEPGRLLFFCTWFDRTDPERPLFDPVTEGILRSKQLLALSADEGHTWSDWREVPTPGLTGCAATGPVLRWADGTLAFAFESFKEYDDPRPARHAAWLLPSRDGGRSFEPPALVARDPADRLYYWDQRLFPLAESGAFVGLFWTHDRAEQRDRPVHLRWGQLGDQGQEPPVATTLPGQIAAPLLLPDGRLLAFVVDRGRPGTLTLWQSDDRGHTWPEARRLVVHTHDERALLTQGREGIDFKQYWEDMGKWTFGHPALRQLADGGLLLAHYAGTPEAMSVHAVRVATE